MIALVTQSLDEKYGLSQKIAGEPETHQIVTQFLARLRRAFGSLSAVRGKKILDIGCGSNASRSPATGKITPMFEPWFCRILVELGADPVGVDMGDLEGELFEHYRVDFGKAGGLDFLPDASFDGIQDSRIFGSPEFTTQHPASEDYERISREIKRQEQRLLRPGGTIVHSDIP
ncbi:MAG: class I SAM-dependent methyltransferase [Dehalococcoidia bacterium]|nr:class I SAM-dependent methyltransferase [Dehalococcoidia bacterium]